MIGTGIFEIEFSQKEVFDFICETEKSHCDQNYTLSKFDFQQKYKNFMGKPNNNISEKISFRERL